MTDTDNHQPVEDQVEVKDFAPQEATKRSTEYSTENYKIELSNLPRKVKFHVIKNLLERNFKLTPHKIKLGQDKAYITFKDETERDNAILALHEQDWKGRTLYAKCASLQTDPAAKRRKESDIVNRNDGNKDVSAEESPSDDAINDQVCPFWSLDYEKQIEFKEQSMRSILNMSNAVQKLDRDMHTNHRELSAWTLKNKKISCEFDGVVHSPVLRGYRNKCEFNIGSNGEVGFMLGRYKNGSDRVCKPPANCPILCEKIYEILDKFRSFLKEKSQLKGFDLVTHEGHYRQITIRRNQNEEYLLIVDMNPQDLSQDDLKGEIENAVNELKSIEGIVSIFYNISGRSSYSSTNQSLKLVHGQDSLVETLNVIPEKPLKFHVGPSSFFQVNTKAAELLYSSIIDVAGLSSRSFVLDVGCGTGTIGLSLANKVNHVIGIEIVPEAIADAKLNAKMNDIENVSFYSGRAEDLIGESLKILKNKMEYQKIEDGEIVAIVDPPRVGFNNSFIKTLRASNIKKLIYVACDPKANTNLLTLCRPTSKAYQGEPFVPVRAKAFDLFPYTKFCELLIVYKRLSLANGD